jgi:hypothetical protein
MGVRAVPMLVLRSGRSCSVEMRSVLQLSDEAVSVAEAEEVVAAAREVAFETAERCFLGLALGFLARR